MATTLGDSAKNEDWIDPSATPALASWLTRAEWLWTLVGIALLGAFLSLVVEDFPLRAVIPGQ
jgi:hypothetical protein